MPTQTQPRTGPRRRSSALLAGLLLLSLSGGALAQDGSGSPGNPGTGIPVSPDPAAGPMVFDDNALPVAPMPRTIVDPQPLGWDHVTIWPDGRTLTVFFWNGAEACYGLDRVELTDVGGTLAITLYTGFRVDAANVRCAEIAQLYSTEITLESPVLGGGISGVTGSQPPSGLEPTTILPGTELLAENIQPWGRVSVGPDGRSLWVWLTGGPEPCFGLSRVELADVGDLPTLQLIAGAPVGSEVIDCVAMILEYRTPVAVPEPILLGGLS